MSGRTLLTAAILPALAAAVMIEGAELARTRGKLARIAADVAVLKARQADAETPHPVSPLLLFYQLDMPGRGEIFPAMAGQVAPDYWPVAILRVTNTANWPSSQTITAEVPGWSQRMEISLIVHPSETNQVPIRLDLLVVDVAAARVLGIYPLDEMRYRTTAMRPPARSRPA